MVKQFLLTVGLNDKDTCNQIIASDVAENMIIDIVLNAGIDGFTLIPVKGLYRMNDGTIVRENSFRIEIADFANNVTREAIKSIIDALKDKLNQESILFEQKGCNYTFI